jgi:DNA-directed RNA polymerase specialized sigma24 family protein
MRTLSKNNIDEEESYIYFTYDRKLDSYIGFNDKGEIYCLTKDEYEQYETDYAIRIDWQNYQTDKVLEAIDGVIDISCDSESRNHFDKWFEAEHKRLFSKYFNFTDRYEFTEDLLHDTYIKISGVLGKGKFIVNIESYFFITFKHIFIREARLNKFKIPLLFITAEGEEYENPDIYKVMDLEDYTYEKQCKQEELVRLVNLVKSMAATWTYKGKQTSARVYTDKEINLFFLYYILKSRGDKVTTSDVAKLVGMDELVAVTTINKLTRFFRYSKQAYTLRRGIIDELKDIYY